MRKTGYLLLRLWIRIALWCYFSKISRSGLAHIPKDKPLLFLANHQNALLDALLIAVRGPRKIYFLTRSDVFNNPLLIRFFEFLQMIPIYRMRDGIGSLQQNKTIFEYCSSLLQRGEAILIFPEGNHSLKRKVRPLSKGFTRFLFAALEKNPQLDIRLLPIGFNYDNAVNFPDKVSVWYGKDLRVLDYYDKEKEATSVSRMKTAVFQELTTLTTHIADDEMHDGLVRHFKRVGLDFLDPVAINRAVMEMPKAPQEGVMVLESPSKRGIGEWAFNILNFPITLIWAFAIRPKIKELEFVSTVRFMWFLLLFPLYYLMLAVLLIYYLGISWATIIVAGHFLFNIGLVKLRS
ncbi:lysophospholipid acyltransferase family protein [Arenibacter lacus]|uniref:lysophospholipid acyltransferase family protein n=1 Tax=Arenibacter lacus TaxID=2608629 RepID=UPI00123C9D22|nr:lysophospholipid acyltransferase family protein [Arenibacter lacus]